MLEHDNPDLYYLTELDWVRKLVIFWLILLADILKETEMMALQL